MPIVLAKPEPAGAWTVQNALVANRTMTQLSSVAQGFAGVYVRPDGLVMYIINSNAQTWDPQYYHLNRSEHATVPYVNDFDPGGTRLFRVAVDSFQTRALEFKPDGTKMYTANILSSATGPSVREYDVSPAWSNSIVFNQEFFYGSPRITPWDIYFKSDGITMIVMTQGPSVYEFTLSTPWDISTASYVQDKALDSHSPQPTWMDMKPDGTKLFFMNGQPDFFEYELSTAWDISTMTHVLTADNPLNPSASNQGFQFSADGTRIFTPGGGAGSFSWWSDFNLSP